MEYWEQLFPGRILHLEYESIIRDQGRATDDLLRFCGLDFEAACLEFHRTERVVRTASFAQVRQPLYGSSVGRYRNYATHLKGLAATIGVPLDGPALTSERPK